MRRAILMAVGDLVAAPAGLEAGKAQGYAAPGSDVCTVPGHYVVMNGTLVVTH